MAFLEEKYAKGAAGYDQRIRDTFPFYETIHPAMNAILRSSVRSDAQLLVVGAGTGGEILEFSRTNPHWRLLGVEPSQAMLDLAKEKVEMAGLSQRVSFFKGFVDELSPYTLYDGATLGLVLHFVLDDGDKLKLLRAIASRLKTGAPLILTVAYGDLTAPEPKLMFDAWKHQQNLAGLTWEQIENTDKQRMQGISYVPAARIEQLLTEAGFQRVQRFFQIFIVGGWIAFKPE